MDTRVEVDIATGDAEIIPMSKYQAKKLAALEVMKNALKVKNNKAVSTDPKREHKKVSRNLLLSLRNTQCTVVCEKTGIVSVLNIPKIPNKVMVYSSPFSDLSNARGIAQEGYDYLNQLDTQILSGIFITLATEYDLLRTMAVQSGAENNAILRTASKEKLIQGILLVECFIHSHNHSYLPKLSLIYEEELRTHGAEGRLTEWMRLVETSLVKPDRSEYDENALGDKPMRSIADLKKEHSARVREEKQKASLKDVNYKARAQFRKDMKEAKSLVKSLKDAPGASFKLVSFLGSLFAEETFLTVERHLLDKITSKLLPIETLSAKRLVEILNVDREELRKEVMIDDLDDPLMVAVTTITVAERSEAQVITDRSSEDTEQEEEYVDAMDHADSIEDMETVEEPAAFAGEFSSISPEEDKQKSGPTMPPGLSFSERIKWKKENL